jgi:hypothetical protein
VEQSLDKKEIGITMFLGLLFIKEQTMTSPDWPAQTENFLLRWTPVVSLAIFVVGYIWHHLKRSFPELFERKPRRLNKE